MVILELFWAQSCNDLNYILASLGRIYTAADWNKC